MSIEPPQRPQFASWRSFGDFAKHVRHERRYVWGPEVKAFIDTVLASSVDREITLKQGRIFFRAQRGIEYRPVTREDDQVIGEEPAGYGRERMKPRANRATEGRVNPAGVPVLYLGSTEETAIAEVRPWAGAEVSVAQFQTLKPLRVIDLTRGNGKTSFNTVSLRVLLGEIDPTPEIVEKAVWSDIDIAFSRPVTLSDDAADYVPTQILAEVFRGAGLDGVVYRSQFGENGFNVALFNPDDAEPINCAPYIVKSMHLKFEECGNRWYQPEKS